MIYTHTFCVCLLFHHFLLLILSSYCFYDFLGNSFFFSVMLSCFCYYRDKWIGNEVTEMHFDWDSKKICVKLYFVVIYVSCFNLFNGHKMLQIKFIGCSFWCILKAIENRGVVKKFWRGDFQNFCIEKILGGFLGFLLKTPRKLKKFRICHPIHPLATYTFLIVHIKFLANLLFKVLLFILYPAIPNIKLIKKLLDTCFQSKQANTQ